MIPQIGRVGEIENRILNYLSIHPDIMATVLVQALRLDRSNLSKQLQKLKDQNGLIYSPFTQTSVKQQDRDVWRLTDSGLGYIIINSNYDPAKVRATIYAYRDKSKQAASLYTMIKSTEEVLGEEKAAATLHDFYNLFVIPALEERIHSGVLMEGANGFLKGRMSPAGFKRWSELLKERTWKESSGVAVCRASDLSGQVRR